MSSENDDEESKITLQGDESVVNGKRKFSTEWGGHRAGPDGPRAIARCDYQRGGTRRPARRQCTTISAAQCE